MKIKKKTSRSKKPYPWNLQKCLRSDARNWIKIWITSLQQCAGKEATQTHQTRGLWPFVCDTSMLLPFDLVQGTRKMIFILLTFFLPLTATHHVCDTCCSLTARTSTNFPWFCVESGRLRAPGCGSRSRRNCHSRQETAETNMKHD